MICFISSDRKSAVRLRKLMLESEIFAYHRKFPNLENAHGIEDFLKTLPMNTSVALIDSTTECDFGESVCKVLQRITPKVLRIVIYDRSKFKFEKFKFFPTSNMEIDVCLNGEPVYSISKILCELGRYVNREYRHLKLGQNRHSSRYLNLPLHISPAEYRILLFLCSQGEKTVSVDSILGHCFAESYRMVDTNIRSHISSINQKARLIGGRRLILAVRGEGYRLNKFM